MFARKVNVHDRYNIFALVWGAPLLVFYTGAKQRKCARSSENRNMRVLRERKKNSARGGEFASMLLRCTIGKIIYFERQ